MNKTTDKNKVRKFLHLDYMTVKPYLTVKNLVIYVLLTLFFAFALDSRYSVIGVSLMFALLFIAYPFVLEEQSNLGSLYVTLGCSRKTVVFGRYLFALLVFGVGVLFSLIIFVALSLFRKDVSFYSEKLISSLAGFAAICIAFLVVVAIQVPIYFKIGYNKAKLVAFFLPFPLIMGSFIGLVYLIQNANPSGIPGIFFTAVLSNGLLAGSIVLALLIAVFIISLKLSLSFYRKREF